MKAIATTIFIAAIIALTPIPIDTPTPEPPAPGYMPPGPNGIAPPALRLPAICAQAMWACGFDYDPGSGTWKPRGTDGDGT